APIPSDSGPGPLRGYYLAVAPARALRSRSPLQRLALRATCMFSGHRPPVLAPRHQAVSQPTALVGVGPPSLPVPGRRAEYGPVGSAHVFRSGPLSVLSRGAAALGTVGPRGSGSGWCHYVGTGIPGLSRAVVLDRHLASSWRGASGSGRGTRTARSQDT